jgi:hypothetical protein
MLSFFIEIDGWYNLTGCRYTLYKYNHFLISILTVPGIHSTSRADNLDFQGLTKHEPLLIHIVNVFWSSIELPNEFSHLQYWSLVKNIEVFKTNLL